MTRRAGVPIGWEAVAERIKAKTGSTVEVRAAPDGFGSTGAEVDVWLDGELLGGSECWWDDADQQGQTDSDLRRMLSDFLDERFPDGWW